MSFSVSPCLRGENRPPTPRLITLTGLGGTGKTRLALQAAQRLRDAYPGGVWFVSLLDLTDPALIPDQMLLSLRLPRTPHREALEQAVAFLSRQPSLLLLDNFEHLVEGGAETVQKLLEHVEHLTVLATSRQRLGLEGEREFPVVPLPVPTVTPGSADMTTSLHSAVPPAFRLAPSDASQTPALPALLAFPSVQLFVDRAQAVRPDFQVTAHNAATVADLCQRLEGLPLALELAAARAGALTPQQMLARLEQRFELLVGRQRSADPRHRSLRATLDWSYQLLSVELQHFFARLSIFRGGWTVEAATAVCCEAPATAVHVDVLDALEELREGSLVQATETAGGTTERSEVVMRFHLLETLREYGVEQLAGDERSALARRHAQFFLALAETAAPELTRADQRLWLDRLEREHDNLRAALDWSVESGEPELGLRLGHALQEFWDRRGYLKEGRHHLLRLLAHPGATAPTAARARALGTAGWFTRLQHDLGAAQRLHEESLAIWRALEDRAGIATALFHLGNVAVDRWDSTTARPLAEESLATRRELGDPRGIADSLNCLAWVARHDRDLPAACALAEESLEIGRALDDRARISVALGSLAHMTFLQGDMERARPLIEESLAAARELDDKLAIAWGITRLGYVAHWQEDYPAARALFEQSLPLWRELDAKDGLTETLFHLAYTHQHQGKYSAAYAIFEEMLAISRDWGAIVLESHTLLGNASGHLGRWEEAAAHCAESLRPHRWGIVGNRHQVAVALTGTARVSLARGRPARAARLLGAAEALWAASSAPRWPNERADFDRLVSTARIQLEETEFADAWTEGQAMPVEAVIAEALQEAPGG